MFASACLLLFYQLFFLLFLVLYLFQNTLHTDHRCHQYHRPIFNDLHLTMSLVTHGRNCHQVHFCVMHCFFVHLQYFLLNSVASGTPFIRRNELQRPDVQYCLRFPLFYFCFECKEDEWSVHCVIWFWEFFACKVFCFSYFKSEFALLTTSHGNLFSTLFVCVCVFFRFCTLKCPFLTIDPLFCHLSLPVLVYWMTRTDDLFDFLTFSVSKQYLRLLICSFQAQKYKNCNSFFTYSFKV